MALLTRAAQEYLNHLWDGEFITYKEANSDVIQQPSLENSLHIYAFCQIFIKHFLWACTLLGALRDGKMKNDTYNANSPTTWSGALALKRPCNVVVIQ